MRVAVAVALLCHNAIKVWTLIAVDSVHGFHIIRFAHYISYPSGLDIYCAVARILQRFRVRHGLSCVIGPVWPVGAGCYSEAALPMPLSKPL